MRCKAIYAVASVLVLHCVSNAAAGARVEVRRTLHIQQLDILEEAMVMSVGYTAPSQNTLVEVVGYGRQREYYFTARGRKDPENEAPLCLIRRSTDNGRTWKEWDRWSFYRPLKGNRRMFAREPNYMFNPKTGTLLRLYAICEDIAGILPWDKRSPVEKTGRLMTQLSRDGGKTWSEEKPLVVSGPDYDETHWAPGLWYGKNSGIVEGVTPVVCPDGRFLVPLYVKKIDTPGDSMSGMWQSACLIGRWGPNDDVEWDMTAFAAVSRQHSSTGGGEPCVTLLPDGRVLMTMRVRVNARDKTIAPSGRWYVTSDDMGKTWSEPELLRYEDGAVVYNPACLAHIFLASKNGRLYIITNILDEPTHGCDPRTTLHIAEINMDTLRVIRDSVTVIESRKSEQGQPPTMRFSNWRRYEDRQTQNIVLFMTGCPGNVGRHETCGVPPHSFRYEIILPAD